MSVENVALLRQAIVNLDKAISEFIESSPPADEVATVLLQLNLAKGDLGMIYDSVASGLSGMIKDKEVLSLDGGAQIEKRSSYDRKGWQHKELANAVVDRIVRMSVDMDTGEVTKSASDIALDIMKYCAPSYWRVKELSSIGINADNYCEVGQLKTSFIVRKVDSQ